VIMKAIAPNLPIAFRFQFGRRDNSWRKKCSLLGGGSPTTDRRSSMRKSEARLSLRQKALVVLLHRNSAFGYPVSPWGSPSWKLNCALRSLDRCVLRTGSSSAALARSCRHWNGSCATKAALAPPGLLFVATCGHLATRELCPLYPRKRTCAAQLEMSAKCQ
jgi:hypothetical protein